MKPPFTLSPDGRYVISPRLCVPYLDIFPGVRYIIPLSDFEVVDGRLSLDEECSEVRAYHPSYFGFLRTTSHFFKGVVTNHLRNPSLVSLIRNAHNL